MSENGRSQKRSDSSSPEGGDAGGRIVIAGTPEDVSACDASHTGRFLRLRARGLTTA